MKHAEPSKVLCFGLNKDGSPRHPLYQRTDAQLLPFFSLRDAWGSGIAKP